MQIIELNGKKYALNYSIYAALRLEEQAGVSVSDFIKRFAEGKSTIKDSVTLIWAGIITQDRALTHEDVSLMIQTPSKLIEVMPACFAAWKVAFSSAEEGKNEQEAEK